MSKKKIYLAIAAVLIAIVSAPFAVIAYHHHQYDRLIQRLTPAVVKDLHDPDSAKFRNVVLKSISVIPITQRFSFLPGEFAVSGIKGVTEALAVGLDDIVMCGEINAKNGFGAYAGFRKFYARDGDPPAVFIDSDRSDNFGEKMCQIETTIYQAK